MTLMQESLYGSLVLLRARIKFIFACKNPDEVNSV